MNEDDEFARALADALGSMYRVSLVDADNRVQASHGAVDGDRVTCARIPLPRSASAVLIEFDVGALERAQRTLQLLSDRGDPAGNASPAFPHLDDALGALISLAEADVGHPISAMTRAEKQQVVRFLDERGAFALRKSVESVADLLGVSRFTVYNYLDSSRRS